jgi:hypothetical protein
MFELEVAPSSRSLSCSSFGDAREPLALFGSWSTPRTKEWWTYDAAGERSPLYRELESLRENLK